MGKCYDNADIKIAGTDPCHPVCSVPVRAYQETPDGVTTNGIPADARYKPGSGGQLVAFVPSLDLVLTRQTGSSGEWAFEEYVRRACAAVLPDADRKEK